MERTLARNPGDHPRAWSTSSSTLFDPAAARGRRGARRDPGLRDRQPARQGHEPGRGPHPPPLPQPDRGDAAHQLLPEGRRTGNPKSYLSLKLDSQRIEELPLPRPFREIFVFSPRVEAIHLRGGKVARGGIRWSDRPRGLPHRGPRPDEGADGEERRHRAGGLQGRLRGQAAAAPRQAARSCQRKGSSATRP